MKKRKVVGACVSVCSLLSFIVWTIIVSIVDVKAIGPKNSAVGLATVNGYFHGVTGVNMPLYTITDWLGLVPIGVMLSFAILGLIEWIKRKRLSKVDSNILWLGGFYIAVFLAYMLFEYLVINYRPVLIDGYLEASYPSSTTMLVLTVMPTLIMQLNTRIKSVKVKRIISVFVVVFIVFMVVGRLISGVHWLSDIIGGILLSVSLVSAYYAVTQGQGCKNE